mmetsp:Transcript_44222/g.140877  ORF Transcript_44222/g.140877 Transcript_44222/m.140877 type:complete len:216 (-) Transcript_44222:310-957(-)
MRVASKKDSNDGGHKQDRDLLPLQSLMVNLFAITDQLCNVFERRPQGCKKKRDPQAVRQCSQAQLPHRDLQCGRAVVADEHGDEEEAEEDLELQRVLAVLEDQQHPLHLRIVPRLEPLADGLPQEPAAKDEACDCGAHDAREVQQRSVEEAKDKARRHAQWRPDWHQGHNRDRGDHAHSDVPSPTWLARQQMQHATEQSRGTIAEDRRSQREQHH